MLNPKIIYLLVAVVFIYIVAKFKLMPYLAARKILKAAKNNGTQQTSAQTLTDQAAPAIPLQLLAAIQQGQAFGSFPVSSVSGSIPDQGHHQMFFDYICIELHPASSDPEDRTIENDFAQIETAVNKFLSDLAKRGICPCSFNLINNGYCLYTAYVTYTL